MNGVLFPGVLTEIGEREQFTNTVEYELNKNRTIHLVGEIDDIKATSVISQMRYLDDKSGRDIRLVINSPGGSVTAGRAIYDYIKEGVRCDVVTEVRGLAASMAAVLLAAGTKGKRYASSGAEVMIHQPLGSVSGQATDISLVADHIQKVKKTLAEMMADDCGQPVRKVLKDIERDTWLTSHEAKEYGLVDHVGFAPEAKEEKYEF